MSYTPPSSDAIDFSIETSTSYSPPSSDAVDLDIGPQNKILSRSVSLNGNGTVETIRSSTTKPRSSTLYGNGAVETIRSSTTKPRSSTLYGNGDVEITRTTTKPRSSTLYGNGGVETTRTTTKSRSSTLYGNGGVETTRTITKSRSVSIHSQTGKITLTKGDLLRPRSVSISGSGEVDSTRSGSSKSRSLTVHGNGGIDLTRQKSGERSVEIFGDGQIETAREKSILRTIDYQFDTGTQITLFDLQEVFPDEEALDVTWDYEFDPRGFVTEWFDEQSDIPRSERGGFGVTFFGRLENEIELWIQHDTEDVDDGILTSDKQTVSQVQQTVVFDEQSEYSDDGLFRVFVRGLRQEDVINQVDVGSVHENL